MAKYATPNYAMPIFRQVSHNPTGIEIHKQTDLCRVERRYGKYGGYRKDILKESLTERDNVLLICEICEGIMREAYISSSGKQFCYACGVQDPAFSDSEFESQKSNLSKPTQNVTATKIINSLKCSCPLLERGCEWLGSLNDCEYHLETCGYVRDKCELGCGAILQRNKLKLHKEERCPQRIKRCEYCQKNCKSWQLIVHTELCPKVNVSCKLECGTIICRENMSEHLKKDCGMVVETCKLGCGMKLTRYELRMHVTNTCVQREIPCEHCRELIKFCDMSNHLDECTKIEVPCELCVKMIFREDIAQHLEQDCVEKEIECPFAQYKCGVGLIKRKDLNEHLEVKQTRHLGLKLNAMESKILKQSEDFKTHKEDMRIKINRMTEHINVLCSVSNTTKLDWNIENISKFIQLNHIPEPRNVATRVLNIHFLKEYIYVDYSNQNRYNDTFSANFLIRLYSTIKCRVVKEYDCGSVSICSETYLGEDRKEIARISKSDVEELCRTECVNKLILEMYITMK